MHRVHHYWFSRRLFRIIPQLNRSLLTSDLHQLLSSIFFLSFLLLLSSDRVRAAVISLMHLQLVRKKHAAAVLASNFVAVHDLAEVVLHGLVGGDDDDEFAVRVRKSYSIVWYSDSQRVSSTTRGRRRSCSTEACFPHRRPRQTRPRLLPPLGLFARGNSLAAVHTLAALEVQPDRIKMAQESAGAGCEADQIREI